MAKENFIFPVKRKKTREEKYALLPPPKEEEREWVGLLLSTVMIIAAFILVPMEDGPLPQLIPSEDTIQIVYIEPPEPEPEPTEPEPEPTPEDPTTPSIPPTGEEWVPAEPPAPEETYAIVPEIPGTGDWEAMIPSTSPNPSPFRSIDPTKFRIPKDPGGREPGPASGERPEPVVVKMEPSGEITIVGVKDERIYWAFKNIIPRLRYLKAKNITGTIGDNTGVGEHNMQIRYEGKLYTIKVDYSEYPIITMEYKFTTETLEELTKIFLADFKKKYSWLKF
jgi:hypothetical protein